MLLTVGQDRGPIGRLPEVPKELAAKAALKRKATREMKDADLLQAAFQTEHMNHEAGSASIECSVFALAGPAENAQRDSE